MIIVVTCLTLGSQLFLKKAISIIGGVGSAGVAHFILAAIQSPYVICAICMQGIGFFLWMFVISRIKLGIAFALSGAFFYILIALSSWILYGEKLSNFQWAGLVLISSGVVMMTISK